MDQVFETLRATAVGIPSTPFTVLRDFYAEEFARIEREFRASSNGRVATQGRAALLDRVILDLSREFLAPELNDLRKLCLVALGGYGRRELFPHSDVDLMFLWEDASIESRYREGTQAICRALWDLRLRVSPTHRFLSECEKFQPDNPEFNISVLDSRYLEGDRGLFERLRNRALPHMIAGGWSDLLRDLAELTEQRHRKEGDTIFHLEPNLKNSPGGLRDYHVAWWVGLISKMEKAGMWATPEDIWPAKALQDMDKAFEFLAAARCFLHYRQGRHDNALSYELQAAAAARGIGVENGRAIDPAEWMRIYFRHARAVYALCTQLLDETLPAPAKLRGFLGWKSSLLDSGFYVAGTRLSLLEPSGVHEPQRLLDVFRYVAKHGARLSREAEDQIHEALPSIFDSGAALPSLWSNLREILLAPHAAEALRAMHSSGLLVRLFPEFAVIDSLVVRDYYHHYTVDAHSFMAIENIHRLREAEKNWERPFANLFSELEEPELLFLSLLFHDVGKGMPCGDHVAGSLDAIENVFARLDLKPEQADTVRFLIRDHLAMSANLLRRDIFDLETIRVFAEEVGTPERLKLLCLFTYADIRAVNPEALTPWKAQSLWQLYVLTANYLSRSLDEERFHAESGDLQFVDRIFPLVSSTASREELASFLEGLPRRYLFAHSAEEIASHFPMARKLKENNVQLRIDHRRQIYALTLLATDRPFLFAGVSGTLASWGMDIWKAEAFANAAGVVVDTFHFTDPHKTLELNPSELLRLQKSIEDVLTGAISRETLLRGRAGAQSKPQPKVSVPTQIRFDDSSSPHSTLMEIVTQDRPGLLFHLSSTLANFGCNIEVALIDTEGQRALDTFYLTFGGAKLRPDAQEQLRVRLLAEG
ncbi:MAG: [protein-PII] uridylyltransferase [Acidobacteria bacterium]|nr:MAG: [protein-PII] uridylyltransferase [Acidobacteriota bacterium]